MKILMMTWKSFGNEDMAAAWKELGHEVIELPYDDRDDVSDAGAVHQFEAKIQGVSPSFVFSFNYFPVAAAACKNLGIAYVSWIYDNPYVRLYHYTVIYPTNYIFIFDKTLYMEFRRAGIPTIHYLPLAANTSRLSQMQDFESFRKTEWSNQKEVAFIGSLYTEKHQFYQRMAGISDYTKGYLEGLMAAQKQIYGYNFIQESLPADIIEDMQRALPMKPGADSTESIEYLFAQYVINRQITQEERMELLSEVAGQFGLDLYTPDKDFRMEGAVNHGPVDYYDFAPYVFKAAKINLNITLRSILSGIPLRGYDIMGAGGFLLTNFQADFLDDFVPGEDFVFYESKRDLMDKIEFYLKHEQERAEIAQNGFRKVAEGHTYRQRAEEMLSYIA